MQQRPLDVLGNSENKRIIIQVKSRDKITGLLKAFDSHLNIWLDEAEVQGQDGDTVKAVVNPKTSDKDSNPANNEKEQEL